MAITSLVTTAQAMSGGAAAVTGVGQDTLLAFGGSWATGDTYTFVFTDGPTGTQTQIGAGFVTGVAPSYVFTYQNKIYALSGPTVYFTAEGSAIIWNDPNGTGNGFVTMSNQYNTPEPLQAVATFQGSLAFFSRNTIQIWNTPENPANWQQTFVLDNIGTFAPNSVQSVGNFDVFFLSDSGIRSLRVLNITLAAYVDDLGSPIDQLVINTLQGINDTQKAKAKGVVEPTFHRYWCYIPTGIIGASGIIYVYSGFRSSKVSAWSTYQPTIQTGATQTYFTPGTPFVIFNGYIYVSDGFALYSYGNPNGGLAGNALYDNAVATVQTPYLDLKRPEIIKLAKSVDIVATGDFTTSLTDPVVWKVSASMDPISGTFETAINQSSPSNVVNPPNPSIQTTNNAGSFPYNDRGTHIAFKAVTSGTGSAVLSELCINYNEGNEKN